jgi:hypothetical protein
MCGGGIMPFSIYIHFLIGTFFRFEIVAQQNFDLNQKGKQVKKGMVGIG